MHASRPGYNAADTEVESSGSESRETKPAPFLSAASAGDPEISPPDLEKELQLTRGTPLEPSSVDEYQQDEDDGPNIFDWFDENLG